MDYADSNGVMKIIETLQYIQWKIMYQIYIKYKTKTTKHLIVYTTMTSKVYAYLNKRLTPIILR
jgi:hypothetical protein